MLFSTTAMVVGKAFRDLEATFDAVTIDKCSQGLEPEIFSALVGCYCTNWETSRLPVFPVGDHKQLRPYSDFRSLL